MSNVVFSLIAGIIQGLTEFLPISSSGHLVLLHDLFGFNLPDDLGFDVILHLGTLLALLVFFGKDILKYIGAFLKSFYAPNFRGDLNQRLAWYILVATIPAVVVGYLWETEFESIFRQPLIVAITFIVVGLLLHGADIFFVKSKNLEQISFGNSIVIGISQALALIPGVSRSGITIIAGLSQKLNRLAAAKFSFLLSIPVVFGAGLKKIIDLTSEPHFISSDALMLAIGFITSAIVGFLCIKYFLRFLESHSLQVFAYYRIILGIFIILFILLTR